MKLPEPWRAVKGVPFRNGQRNGQPANGDASLLLDMPHERKGDVDDRVLDRELYALS